MYWWVTVTRPPATLVFSIRLVQVCGVLGLSNFNNRNEFNMYYLVLFNERILTFSIHHYCLTSLVWWYIISCVFSAFILLVLVVVRNGLEKFSKDSVIWWCRCNHWINRKRNQDKMQRIGLETGKEVGRWRMRRISGWGSELKQRLSDVQKMMDLRRAKCD